jgi:hypothetical protein
MFGTCNAISRYEDHFARAKGVSGWRTDALMNALKASLEEARVALQSPEGGMAYLRTAKDFFCCIHEYKAGERPPLQPSMTAQGARSGG